MAKPTHIPPLSAEWVNDRYNHVYAAALGLLDGILDDLTSSGYLPLEGPADSNTLKRLTPEQRAQYGVETPEELGARLAEEELASLSPYVV